MKRLLFIFFALVACAADAQEFRKGINKDSLFRVILATFPAHMKAEMQERYKNGSQMERDMMLIWFSDPVVTKADLVSNIDSNFSGIQNLKTYFDSIVPKGYEVYVEVTPPSRIFESEETYDIWITPVAKGVPGFREWSIPNGSTMLKQALGILQWTPEMLERLKAYLNAANCISIENGEVTTIGFARSGMGKFSFKLFQNDLSPDEVNHYNDGCTYIFYKKNIVLQYGGGAVGPQCFPGK